MRKYEIIARCHGSYVQEVKAVVEAENRKEAVKQFHDNYDPLHRDEELFDVKEIGSESRLDINEIKGKR